MLLSISAEKRSVFKEEIKYICMGFSALTEELDFGRIKQPPLVFLMGSSPILPMGRLNSVVFLTPLRKKKTFLTFNLSAPSQHGGSEPVAVGCFVSSWG